MAYPKGKPRPKGAGRQPGSLNKRTTVLDKCIAMGYDPFEAMIKLAQSGDESMIKELCQYLEPKKKSMDVAIDPSQNLIKVVIEDYGKKE